MHLSYISKYSHDSPHALMLSCCYFFLLCLLICTMLNVSLYVHYTHTCMFCQEAPYVHVHAYVYAHISCSILCTHHSLFRHHSASILSQSDSTECGFSNLLWTSCSLSYVMGAYQCSRSTMEFCRPYDS